MILLISLIISSYLIITCITPPNPSPSNRYKTDRVFFLTGSVPSILRHLSILLFAYHALLTFFHNTNNQYLNHICPHPSNINNSLFTWSPTTLITIPTIILGSIIRLSAFGRLGQNFTFQIAPPDRLITTGVYAYLQHPSYTGLLIVCLGCGALFHRWDGAVGCWLSAEVVEGLSGWGLWVIGLLGMLGAGILRTRMVDEERMLKERFGEEWEGWNKRTKRLIPGVI